MKRIRYTEEFKAEAIKQITERGHGVVEVSKRLGISDKSLYAWLRKNKAASAPDATLVDGVNLAVERFEASHPTLAGTLRNIMQSLANMGI